MGIIFDKNVDYNVATNHDMCIYIYALYLYLYQTCKNIQRADQCYTTHSPFNLACGPISTSSLLSLESSPSKHRSDVSCTGNTLLYM